MSSREILGATSSQWVHLSLRFVRGVGKPVFSYFCFFLGSYLSEDIKVQKPLGCFSLYNLLVSQTQNLHQILFITGLVFSCDLKRLICLNLLTIYCCRAEVLIAAGSHCYSLTTALPCFSTTSVYLNFEEFFSLQKCNFF